MPEEGSSSLFDLAGKMQKKKGKSEPKQEPAGESPALPQATELPPAPQTQEELQAAFLRCKEMHDQLKNKIETAFEDAKVSPRKFREYVDTPTHFSSKDWNEVQKIKRQYEEKLKELLPEQIKVAEGAPEGVPEEGEKKKIKSSFMSRKRWLSMH